MVAGYLEFLEEGPKEKAEPENFIFHRKLFGTPILFL
jgi:hypothetical protein